MAKRPEFDIYKAIRRNNTIVWALAGAFLIGMLFMSVAMFRMYRYQMNHTLTLDKNGEVLPLTWIPRQENMEIEMKHHVEMFLDYFYCYDRNNWKKQVNKAIWLSDQSVEKLVLSREEQGWFNEVTSMGTSQRVVFNTDSIKITGSKEPFEFEVPAYLIIKTTSQQNMYYFRAHGYLLSVNRNYPYNPHGFLVSRYREMNKQLVKEK